MSATWWNSRNWIHIRHPGYEDDCNVLLLLYAFDHPLGGTHYQTALTACGILAGNRWDGVLTTSRIYAPQPPPPSGILVAKDVYFHLPDWQPKPTDVGDDVFLAYRYPIVRSFEDWIFPHDNLPPIWEAIRDPPSNAGSEGPVELPLTQASNSAQILDDDAAALTKSHCQICDHPKCDAEPWMLVPSLYWKWFTRNSMQPYLQVKNVDPIAEVGDQEAEKYKLRMVKRSNVVSVGRNCIGERHPCDLWTALAAGQFSFAPKYEVGGNATLVAHMFAPQMGGNSVYWDQGLHSAHDSLLQRPESLSLEMLFSRFALGTFQNLDLFLQAGVPRDLSVLDHKNQLHYFTASSSICAESFVSVSQWSVEHHDTSFRLPTSVGPLVCDCCDQSFYGLRYKCLDCPDFDYCSVCIENASSTHPDHLFLSIHQSAPDGESIQNDQRDEHCSSNLDVVAKTSSAPIPEGVKMNQELFLSAQDIPANAKMTYYDLPIMSEDDLTIRLLVLWPGPEFSPIQGHLIVSPLLQCPPYEALSYTWGDPAEKSPIHISGGMFSAQRNLKSALHHLRYLDKVRVLWVDALCINQTDNKEKSSQVAQMGNIYKRAEQTTVWLGEAGDDSHEAIEECKRACHHFASIDSNNQKGKEEDFTTLLRDVEEQFYSLFEKESETESNMQFLRRMGWDNPDFDQIPKDMIPDNVAEATFFRLLGLAQSVFRAENLGPFAIEKFLRKPVDSVGSATDEDSDDSIDFSDSESDSDGEIQATGSIEGKKFTFQHIKGIQALLKRPWFQRLWIIQEVALASKVTMFCGHSSIDWWIFNLAAKFAIIHGKGLGIASEPGFSTCGFICQSHQRIYTTSEEESTTEDEFGLLDVLQMFRKQKATDPKDNVYGLISLLEEPAFKIDLNYDHTVKEVYTEIATLSLIQSRSLDILSIPRLAGGREDMYSWVPDWGDERFLPNPLNGYPSYSGAYVRQVFRASRDSEVEVSTLSTTKPLPLRGYEVDSIAALGKPLEPQLSAIDPIRMENILHAAVQSVNPEVLLRSLLSQCTQGLKLWEAAIEWRRIALDGPSAYPTGEDNDAVFWKTLQATVYIDGEESTQARHDEFFRDVEARRDRCLKLLGLANFDDPWTSAKAIIDLMTEMESGSQTEAVWEQFLCADVVLERAVMRRLGRTAKGYLALLPFDTLETDIIVLLQGGKTPYVIRRKEGCWQFVGDCYVHGIMDGDAWDDSKLENITLV